MVKMNKSMTFGTFKICNKHFCVLPKHFYHPKRKPCNHEALLPNCSPPQPPAITNLLYPSMDLPILSPCISPAGVLP